MAKDYSEEHLIQKKVSQTDERKNNLSLWTD